MAPEQILDRIPIYTEKFDVWSLGSIYYELVIGLAPFLDKDRDIFYKKLEEGNYSFPKYYNISPEGMLFISRCLQYHEENRASIWELIKDSYLSEEFFVNSPLKNSMAFEKHGFQLNNSNASTNTTTSHHDT